MPIFRSLAQTVLNAASPSLGRKAWFRSQLTEPEAIDLYRSFRRYCVNHSYSRSEPYPTETVALMWKWAQWCFGKDVCPTVNDFPGLLAQGGDSIRANEQTIVYPGLFNAVARATRGMPHNEWQDIRTTDQAAAFLDSRIRDQQQTEWQPTPGPEQFSSAAYDSCDGIADDPEQNVDDMVHEINRMLWEDTTDEPDPRITVLEEQVLSLERDNQRLVEAAKMASPPVSEGASRQRIENLGQTVRDQEAQIERLRKAGKAVIAQREDWKAKAITAEEALNLIRNAGTNRNDKLDALRRLIAKELHPDICAAQGIEKVLRAELFKLIWPKIEELCQPGAAPGSPPL